MVVPASLTSPILEFPSLRHGFFLRKGGVCQGLQDGLSDDLAVSFKSDLPDEEVRENRRRVEAEFGAPFVTAEQVHGINIIKVTEPWDALTTPKEADGLVTTQADLGLGILTADCAPILFADVDAGVIGACHAGWRGLKAGVMEATVAAMIDAGARRSKILSAVGPCLDRVSYEVGLEFPDHFASVLEHHRSFFRPAVRRDRLMFDMPRVIRVMAENLGLKRPDFLGNDTFTEKDNFFSHRRATQAQDVDQGRQISLIALK